MSPIETLRQYRAAGLLEDLPPMVALVEAVDPTADFDPSRPRAATARLVPHPALAAGLMVNGATRRGAATFSVGLGDDDPHPEAIAWAMDHTTPGVWYAGNMAANTKGPRNVWATKDRINNARYLHVALIGTPAADVVPNGYLLHGAPERVQQRHNALSELHPYTGPARYSLINLKVENFVAYVQFFTHLPVDGGVPDQVARIFDVRPAGRSARQPKPLRPVDLYGPLEWLVEKGMPVLDPHAVWSQLCDTVTAGVVAWPQPGAPAFAALTVPAHMANDLPEAEQVRFALTRAGATSQVAHGSASSADLHTLLESLPEASHRVDASVADILAMHVADPYLGEAPLHEHQRVVAGWHLATTRGLVNTLPPGAGKTPPTLAVWQSRSREKARFRALVVTEAALRTQWVGEVEKWFPESTVLTATSVKDVDKVADALEGAGPVVVVVAYSAMRHVADTAARRRWNETYPELAAALAAAETAEAEGGEPAPAVLGQGELDLALADPDGQEPAAEGEDDVPQPPANEHPLGALLLDTAWDELAADEAEPLRGTASKASKGCWALRDRAKVGIVLTGTPINKSVDDLGRLLAFARNEPELFDGVRLSTRFDVASDEDLEKLTAALGPTVFRRATSETTGKMPHVNPHVVMLEPTAAEIALDQAARDELKRVYEELVELMEESAELDPGTPEYAEAAERLREARGAWLGGTTLARQAASDPAALLGAHSAAAELLAAQGVIAAATAQQGSKRSYAIPDITERVFGGEKVLIFTEFKTVAHALIADLEQAGVKVGQVLGGGGKRRDADVAAFQAGRLDALVLTSSGEKGLNLQAATTLVHYDLPWTPKGVLQRTGRARRLASDNDSIDVVFYVLKHTIEERVAALVVSRAVEAMRVLDTARGLAVEETDLGSVFSGLAQAAAETREGRNQSVLMEVTRQLVAAGAGN